MSTHVGDRFTFKNIWGIATTIIACISILKLFGDFRYISLSQYFENIIQSYKEFVYPLLSFVDYLFMTNEFTKDWIFASFFIIDQVFFKFGNPSEYKWLRRFTSDKVTLNKYNVYANLAEQKLIALAFALFMGIGVSGAYYIGPYSTKVNNLLDMGSGFDGDGHDIILPMMAVFFFLVPLIIVLKALIFNVYLSIFRIIWHTAFLRIPLFLKRRVRLLNKAWQKFEDGKRKLIEKLSISIELLIYSLKIGFIIFLLLGLNYFLFLAET